MKKLSSETIEKLESVVLDCYKSGHILLGREKVAQFYGAVGNEERRLEWVRQDIEERTRRFLSDDYNFEHYPESTPLDKAIKLNLPEPEIKELAKKMFEKALEKEAYGVVMAMVNSGHVEASAEKKEEWGLKCLYGELVSEYYTRLDDKDAFVKEYITNIRRFAKELLKEKVMVEAQKAYGHLDKEGEHYINAILAHLLLTKEQSDQQVEKYAIENEYSMESLRTLFERCKTHKKVRKRCELLQQRRGHHLYEIKITTEPSNQEAQELLEKGLNEDYKHAMKEGEFGNALKIRKKEPKIVKDDRLTVKELEILVGLFKE